MTKEEIYKLGELGYSYYEIREKIEQANKCYLVKPIKPKLADSHTAKEAIRYAELLAQYESDLAKYEKESDEIYKYNCNLNELFREYLKDKSGFNSLSQEEQSLVIDLTYSLNLYDNGLIQDYESIESIVNFINKLKSL